MASPSPREVESRLQLRIDAEMRAILEFTARRLRARIIAMGSSFSKDIRKAQLDLILKQLDGMLAGTFTGPITDTLMRESKRAAEAAEELAETLTRPLYGALPPAVADALTDGLRLSADSAIRNAFARTPRVLSSQVWDSGALAGKWMNDLIMSGLASGLSAREMAREVYEFASPNTPGGASYAAMRLARTEINNAFHNRQREGGKRPGVKWTIWNLSGSHKVPDECNVLAAKRKFLPDAVPDKPHPQCFCYLTYETMTSDELLDAMTSGELADELDKRTKANLARVGGGRVNTGAGSSTLKPGQIDATADIQKIIRDNERGASQIVAKRYGLTTNEAVTVTVKVRNGGKAIITPGPNADDNAGRSPDVKRPTKRATPGKAVPKAKPVKPGGDTSARVGQPYDATKEIKDLLRDQPASAAGTLRLRYGLTLAESRNAIGLVRDGKLGVITPKKINLALVQATVRKTPAQHIKRMHKEGNEKVVAELKRQFDHVPRTMAEMNQVVIAREGTPDRAVFDRDTGSSALAAYWFGQKTIRLHPKIFDRGADARKDSMVKAGWFSQCGASHSHAEATMAHECGHHIANIMERDLVGFTVIINAIAEELGVDPPVGAYTANTLKPWTDRNKRQIIQHVSRYGSSSGHELLAEIWAEYSTNKNARPLAKRIGKLIQAAAEKQAK